MFKRVAATAVLLCAVLMPSGCSPPISLYLINHTERPIQVLQSAGRWRDQEGVVHVTPWHRVWSWPFLIDPGMGRHVDDTYGNEWIIDARVAGCRVRFEVPTDLGWRPGQFSGHFTVQLEADSRLYLVPAVYNGRTRAVDIASFAAIQPGGFPVEPTSRVCRSQ